MKKRERERERERDLGGGKVRLWFVVCEACALIPMCGINMKELAFKAGQGRALLFAGAH